MLTSLNRLIGMPVIWQDRQLGYVERGVPDDQAKRLMGVIFRRGIGAARWVPSEGLRLVGQRCVLIRQKPEAAPTHRQLEMKQVYLTSGERVGQVEDGVLDGLSLRVLALEISPGPIYRLMGNCAYADEYRMIKSGERKGQVVVAGLQTWAELQRNLGKEEGL